MFYDTFLQLCNSVNKSPSAVVTELGMNKSAVTNWKNRRTPPRDATLQKIADYFNVSVEYLLTGEKKSPDIMSEDEEKDEITYDDFTYAMYGHSKELTDEQKQLLLQLAEDMRRRRGL